MRKLVIAVLVITSLFKTETVWSGTPERELSGNSQFIHYDAEKHLWINTNNADMWMNTLSQEDYEQILGVPEKHHTVIVVRSDLARKPEVFCASAFFAVAQQARRRFVLINVEQTLWDVEVGRQYRTWPHLGMLYVGTAAHEEGYDVVLWDELVQGHCDLGKLVQPGDVVGLGLVVTGVERGVELAKQAKTLGASAVIAGNDSAIFRANEILSLPGHPIDAVFTSNSLASIRNFFHQFGKVELSRL